MYEVIHRDGLTLTDCIPLSITPSWKHDGRGSTVNHHMYVGLNTQLNIVIAFPNDVHHAILPVDHDLTNVLKQMRIVQVNRMIVAMADGLHKLAADAPNGRLTKDMLPDDAWNTLDRIMAKLKEIIERNDK